MTAQEPLDATNPQWVNAVQTTVPDSEPISQTWQGLPAVLRQLAPFINDDLNHVVLPDGRISSVRRSDVSEETGCMELLAGDRILLLKPDTLHFEYLSDSPVDSFCQLHAARLHTTGIHTDRDPRSILERVIRLPGGELVDSRFEQYGHMGHDEYGNEIALPQSRVLVDRFLSGTFLFVARGGLWMKLHAARASLHSNIAPQKIRMDLLAALDFRRQQDARAM